MKTKESRREAPIDPRLVLRIGWLAVLVTVMHFWTQRHLGWSLIKGVGGSVAGTAFFGFLTWLLTQLGQREAVDIRVRHVARRILRWAVSVPFLVLVTTMLFVLGSAFASVRLDASNARSSLSFCLSKPGDSLPSDTAAAHPHDVPAGEVKRMLRPTTLFGRAYKLNVKGYRPVGLELRPWVGAGIQIPDDLQRWTTVLIRYPPIVFPAIVGSRFELHRLEPGKEPELLGSKEELGDGSSGSILVGPPAHIPVQLTARWRMELAGMGFKEASLSRKHLAWSEPLQLRLDSPLMPGQKIRAEVIAGGNVVLARRDIVVSSGPFQDVLLAVVHHTGDSHDP